MRFNREMVRVAGALEAQLFPYNYSYGAGGLVSDCFGVWTRGMRKMLGNMSDDVNLGYIAATSAFFPMGVGDSSNVVVDGEDFDWDEPNFLLQLSAAEDPDYAVRTCQPSEFTQRVLFLQETMFALVGNVFSVTGGAKLVYDHFVYVDVFRRELLDRGYSGQAIRRVSFDNLQTTEGILTSGRAMVGLYIQPELLYHLARTT